MKWRNVLLRKSEPCSFCWTFGRRRIVSDQMSSLYCCSKFGIYSRKVFRNIQTTPNITYSNFCTGATILFYVSLEDIPLGVNGINPNTTPFGGFIMEMLLTMLLVLVVYATAVDKRNNSSPMLPPLLIGLTVTVAHLVCIPYTGWGFHHSIPSDKIFFPGTSINPARSLGPAIIKNQWDDHWVFWVGPIAGGGIGGLLYKFVFSNSKTNMVANKDDFWETDQIKSWKFDIVAIQ